ncbi:hypothetical protein [Shewanella sp. MBTL60-007]|uniref:hypothetical protein n=1 Tax=Shewanella sp. MBTL60-007 TaxID=2815911 RepID=UPI001BBCE010|nr:hypothetical protein [Shewanella sp. MBTL60-007]GIU21041.1 hypothetical protein TUM3792_21480 [Shewanella sp. MBTL60-007]
MFILCKSMDEKGKANILNDVLAVDLSTSNLFDFAAALVGSDQPIHFGDLDGVYCSGSFESSKGDKFCFKVIPIGNLATKNGYAYAAALKQCFKQVDNNVIREVSKYKLINNYTYKKK